MTDESSKGIWAIVGKIAVVVSIVGGLIGIYSWYFPKAAKLSATVQYSDINLPDKLVEQLKASNKDEIEKEIAPSVLAEYPGEKIYTLFKNGREARQKLIDEITSLNSYYEVSLQNSGGKEASNLTLEIPNTGLFQTRTVYGYSDLKPFNRTIPLDNLRPTHNVLISIWSTDTSPNSTLGLIKITSPEDAVFPERSDKQMFSMSLTWQLMSTLLSAILLGTIAYITARTEFTKFLRKQKNESSKQDGK